jgi:hypothetical protein
LAEYRGPERVLPRMIIWYWRMKLVAHRLQHDRDERLRHRR